MTDKTPIFRSGNSRLKGELRPEMAVVYPVPDARIAFVLEGVHRFDKAHIVMLHETGLIDRDSARQMLGALLALEQHPGGVVPARLAIGGGNHSGEKHLAQAVGEASGKIHAGRSSSDISAVANRLTQQRYLTRVMVEVIALRRRVLALAERDRDIVVMGYSHLQHAQPTTFGHYWASWLAVLERDFARLHALYRRFDYSPAGSAVLTGSRFALRPERTAELLGLGASFDNSRDASWGCDCFLDAAGVLAIVLATAGRIADELYLWSSHEFALVELADGFCINSSILPQKKNPIALEHIRGVAKTTAARMGGMFSIFAAPTDSVVFDRYLATEELFRSFEDGLGALALLVAVLGDLKVDAQAAARAFQGSWSWTSDLAAALVLQHGLSWRAAQQSVSVLVRVMLEQGRAPESVREQDVQAAVQSYTGKPVQLEPGFVAAVTDPQAIVDSRIVPGGPRADDVARQLKRFAEGIALDSDRLAAIERQHTQGLDKLDAAVASILS